MGVNLTGLFGDIGNLASSISMQDIVATAATGAIASVGLAGLKTQAGLDAVDPLHIFHKDPVLGNPGSVVVGKTISAAAFGAMPAEARSQLMAAGYTIV